MTVDRYILQYGPLSHAEDRQFWSLELPDGSVDVFWEWERPDNENQAVSWSVLNFLIERTTAAILEVRSLQADGTYLLEYRPGEGLE